jgi:hypothetical protein
MLWDIVINRQRDFNNLHSMGRLLISLLITLGRADAEMFHGPPLWNPEEGGDDPLPPA